MHVNFKSNGPTGKWLKELMWNATRAYKKKKSTNTIWTIAIPYWISCMHFNPNLIQWFHIGKWISQKCNNENYLLRFGKKICQATEM